MKDQKKSEQRFKAENERLKLNLRRLVVENKHLKESVILLEAKDAQLRSHMDQLNSLKKNLWKSLHQDPEKAHLLNQNSGTKDNTRELQHSAPAWMQDVPVTKVSLVNELYSSLDNIGDKFQEIFNCHRLPESGKWTEWVDSISVDPVLQSLCYRLLGNSEVHLRLLKNQGLTSAFIASLTAVAMCEWIFESEYPDFMNESSNLFRSLGEVVEKFEGEGILAKSKRFIPQN